MDPLFGASARIGLGHFRGSPARRRPRGDGQHWNHTHDIGHHIIQGLQQVDPLDSIRAFFTL